MTRHRLLPLLVLAICFAQPAWAQINPFVGRASQPLTKEDLEQLGDATMRLLERTDLKPGAVETWHNDATSAGGTVTAGTTVKREGYTCRVLSYQNTPTSAGPRALPSVRLNWCLTPAGWKIG